MRLPVNPESGRGVVLGEGKPENQNHAIIFCFNETLQAIDMNQVGCVDVMRCCCCFCRCSSALQSKAHGTRHILPLTPCPKTGPKIFVATTNGQLLPLPPFNTSSFDICVFRTTTWRRR